MPPLPFVFPFRFPGSERKVDITGEAYFEVAKDPHMPFIVNTNGLQVQVLGTHFDVNAYGDGQGIKTTLFEGSVKMVKGKNTMILSPGQQAILNNNDRMDRVDDIDAEEVISWKDGYFHFINSDLKSVLLQLSRWYDVEIIYPGKVPNEFFGGDIERNLDLTEVVNILEKSQVHVKIDGRKLIVGN